MSKIIFSFVGILLFLTSCNNGNRLTEVSIDSSCPLINDEQVKDIESGLLSSVIDSMRLVPLDDSQLVGNIKRIRYANGNLHILTEEKLMLFDEDGNFIKIVAIKGQGPDEVLEFSDFDVDSTGIVVLDPNKFLFFDTDGCLVRTVANNFGFGLIRLIPGGSGWVMKAIQPTDNNHMLIVYNNQGDTIFTAFEPYDFEVSWVQDLFHLNDSVFLNPLRPAGGNELRALNINRHGGAVIPISVTGDPLSAKDYELTVNASGGKLYSPQLCFCGFADNKSQLYFSAFKKGKSYDYVYDKETGKTIKMHLDDIKNDLTVESEGFHPFSMIFRTSSDNDLFAAWISDPLATYEQSDKLNSRYKAEYSKLANLDDDSNPVIVFFKFNSPAKYEN